MEINEFIQALNNARCDNLVSLSDWLKRNLFVLWRSCLLRIYMSYLLCLHPNFFKITFSFKNDLVLILVSGTACVRLTRVYLLDFFCSGI